MKLELKAYKCIFPNFYVDAYNDDMWLDDKQYEVIWGKNQKDAVRKKCLNDEIYTYWELKKHIRTRRFSDLDLYSQETSDLIKDVPMNLIKHLTHSLGVQLGQVCPKEFYRNYSMYYSKNTECEILVGLGLMSTWEKLDSQIYAVTEKGIEAVKTLLLNTK